MDENIIKEKKESSNDLLIVKDLSVSMNINSDVIINNVSFNVNKGEVLVIIGPNGSGKSTIAKALTGFPGLEIKGSALFKQENLFDLSPAERSKNGLFLSFQNPVEIQGVTVSNFLRTAINARRPKDSPINIRDFIAKLNDAMSSLGISKEFAHRELNHGFSGGEKKKAEMLQLLMLAPDLAILDETDSGLDIDALKSVCAGINKLKMLNSGLGLIVITHYKRMLEYLNPDRVLVLINGEIKKEGDAELVNLIEEKGFEGFK